MSNLLISFGLLAILAVLMFPGFVVYLDRHRGPSPIVKSDVTQIATAVAAFVSEYGHLPATNDGILGGQTLAALMGSNNRINPIQIVFIEVQDAKKGKSGTRDGIFVDPWGVPYRIAFDSNNDGFVIAGTNGVKVRKQVAVWSDPSQEKSEAVRKRRYATSWE